MSLRLLFEKYDHRWEARASNAARSVARFYGTSHSAQQLSPIAGMAWPACARSAFHLIAILFLMLGSSGLLKAQQMVTSSISGTVQDPNKYAIGGASLTLTDQGTGKVSTLKSSGTGEFRFSNLSLGTYTLQVEEHGFKKYKKVGIVLTSDQELSIGPVTLPLGDVSLSVTVEADADQLDTTTPNHVDTLGGEELQEVAERSGDPVELLSFLPGVSDSNPNGHDVPALNTIGSLTFDGVNASDGQVNINLNGVSNASVGNPGYLTVVPSVDMIKEIKITHSNYTASTGGQGGPTVSIITKGGQQKYHGSFSFPYRNAIFNANSPDNKKIYPALPRPTYDLQLPGGTFSGPLQIPHLIPKRAGFFFFVGVEYQHQVTPSTSPQYDTVPTAAERLGNFQNSVDNGGNRIIVVDPTITYSATGSYPCGTANVNGHPEISSDGTAAGCNIIPPSLINTNLQKVLNLLPLPNSVSASTCTGGLSPCGANYQYTPSYLSNRTTYTGSLDWQPSRRPYSISLRYTTGPYLSESTQGGGLSSNSVPLGEYANVGRNQSVSLNVNNTIRPTLINSAVGGFNFVRSTNMAVNPTTLTVASTGIIVPELYPSAPNPGGLLPDFLFGGSNINNGPSIAEDYRNPARTAQVTVNFADNLTKVFSHHTVAAGVAYTNLISNGNVQINSRGSYNFDVNSQNVYDTNDTFANGLVGTINQYIQSPSRPQQYLRQRTIEYYLQDEWRVRHNLTVTFGSRSYQDPNPYEKENKLYGFLPSFYSQAAAPQLYRPACTVVTSITVTCPTADIYAVDPINANLTAPVSYTGFLVPNSGNFSNGLIRAGSNGVPRSITTRDQLLLSPRAGFAWTPFGDQRTVVRGGSGIYFSTPSFNASGIFAAAGPPPSQGPQQLNFLTVASLAADSGTSLLTPSATVLFPALKVHPFTTYTYSLGVDHEFNKSLTATVNYVGRQVRHEPFQRNINPIPIGARFNVANLDPRNTSSGSFDVLPDIYFNKYPGYTNLNQTFYTGSANYNGLQVSVRQNVRRYRLTINEYYTYSKQLGTTGVTSYYPAEYSNYGHANGNDRPHIANMDFIYYLPRPGHALHSHLIGAVTDGWELSGNVSFGAAGYVTPGFNISQNIVFPNPQPGGGYVTLGSSFNLSGSTDGTRLEMVNPHASRKQGKYAAPELGTFGNIGPTGERGVGYVNDSLSVSRNFVYKERLRFNFRASAYNLTNTEIPTNNDANYTFSAPGSLTNLDPNSFTTNEVSSGHERGRVMQFDFRLQF